MRSRNAQSRKSPYRKPDDCSSEEQRELYAWIASNPSAGDLGAVTAASATSAGREPAAPGNAFLEERTPFLGDRAGATTTAFSRKIDLTRVFRCTSEKPDRASFFGPEVGAIVIRYRNNRRRLADQPS
jgi:hypothetical protein